jgi:hypothetical protein
MKKDLCVNPWLGLHINGTRGYNPCCLYTKNFPVNLRSYVEKDLKDIKDQFLNGSPPESCKICYDQEARGLDSKRMRDNRTYGHFLKRSIPSDGNDKFVEYYIRLGNHCNLRCMTCNSSLSSSWISEDKRFNEPHPKVWSITNEHEIWNHIKERSRNVGLINFIGGEPFMMLEKAQADLLDSLIASKDNSHIILQYNTNCTKRPEFISNKWPTFKRVDIKISMDGIGSQFEYLRYPAKWDDFLSNLDWLQSLSQQHTNIELTIIYTISVFNLGYISQAERFCKERGLKVFWNILEQPYYFNPANVPAAKKWILDQKIETSDIDVRKYIDALSANEGLDMTEQFKNRVSQIDSRRSIRLQDAFSELAASIDLLHR